MLPSLKRIALLLACGMLATPTPASEPDFTRDVRPILARYCFKCHGPDEQTRKAGLRLDLAEAAHKSAIVPGQPDRSELIARVFARDADMVMPPPRKRPSPGWCFVRRP